MLLRAMLLQAFYGIRSERQLIEPMEFDLLFSCFFGLGVDYPAADHSAAAMKSPSPHADGPFFKGLPGVRNNRAAIPSI